MLQSQTLEPNPIAINIANNVGIALDLAQLSELFLPILVEIQGYNPAIDIFIRTMAYCLFFLLRK